jgi:cysteine sulfinate desulfinase/cysteine desulfurase-like protein
MLARVLDALFAAILAAPTSAWDNFGHMEVAQIAWDLLNDDARTGVAQLIGLNPQYVAWTVYVAPENQTRLLSCARQHGPTTSRKRLITPRMGPATAIGRRRGARRDRTPATST